jgi:hypothetical protein
MKTRSVEVQHAIRNVADELHLKRRVQYRLGFLVRQRTVNAQLLPRQFPGQCRGHFVERSHPWFQCERASNRYPLFLASTSFRISAS